VPVATNIRYRVDNKLYDQGDFSSNIETTVQVIVATSNIGLGDTTKLIVDRILSRQALIAYTPGIIMQRTPSYFPYQGIGQLLLFPAYIIPRGLWPGKPLLSRGNWFSINYLNQPDTTSASAAITIFGDGYIYSGWLGTILACFILGFLAAFLYRNLATTGLVPIFIILLIKVIDVEGQFAGIFVSTVQSSVIYILAYSLMSLFSRQGREARNTTAGSPSWAHPKVIR
jgi:hypothetical protein